jgi:hypothetical protein
VVKVFDDKALKEPKYRCYRGIRIHKVDGIYEFWFNSTLYTYDSLITAKVFIDERFSTISGK